MFYRIIFYSRKFSNSSIKQNSPNVLFTVKKFKLLRLGARSRTWTGTALLPRDFKSLASAYSAIRARVPYCDRVAVRTVGYTKTRKRLRVYWRRHPELNRGLRLCRPLPYRLAMAPNYGGNNRARTCDPLLVRQMLSQLSYAPVCASSVERKYLYIISNLFVKINPFTLL